MCDVKKHSKLCKVCLQFYLQLLPRFLVKVHISKIFFHFCITLRNQIKIMVRVYDIKIQTNFKLSFPIN